MSVVICDYNHNTKILPFVKEAANNITKAYIKVLFANAKEWLF